MNKKSMILPLPAGKGAGGMGAGRQVGGKVGRQPPPAAPLRGQRRQGRQARRKTSPPAALVLPAPGERTISNAAVACDGWFHLPRSPLSLAAGTARRELLPAVFAANRGFSRRGAGGASPRRNKVKSLPLPVGKGAGGWGQEGKLVARSAGDCPPAPPSGHRNATPTPPCKRRSPRRNSLSTRKACAARVQPRGCKGRSPLHEITISLPLPAGKGDGGMGAKR